jgi:hypothetical protein
MRWRHRRQFSVVVKLVNVLNGRLQTAWQRLLPSLVRLHNARGRGRMRESRDTVRTAMAVMFVARVVVRHTRLRRHRATMSASGRKLWEFGHNGLMVARVVIQVKFIGIIVVCFRNGRGRLSVVLRTRTKAVRSPIFCWSSW